MRFVLEACAQAQTEQHPSATNTSAESGRFMWRVGLSDYLGLPGPLFRCGNSIQTQLLDYIEDSLVIPDVRSGMRLQEPDAEAYAVRAL